jgi:predicted ester cyclase
MSVELNKAISRRFHDEVINGQNFDLAREILATELGHARGAIGYTISKMATDAIAGLRELKGPDRFIAATKVLRTLFPEWVSTLNEMIAEGDKVVTKCTVRGRDVGGSLGTGPADGAPFELEQMIIQTFENGKIVKIYALSDELGFWRTLGAELPS